MKRWTKTRSKNSNCSWTEAFTYGTPNVAKQLVKWSNSRINAVIWNSKMQFHCCLPTAGSCVTLRCTLIKLCVQVFMAPGWWDRPNLTSQRSLRLEKVCWKKHLICSLSLFKNRFVPTFNLDSSSSMQGATVQVRSNTPREPALVKQAVRRAAHTQHTCSFPRRHVQPHTDYCLVCGVCVCSPCHNSRGVSTWAFLLLAVQIIPKPWWPVSPSIRMTPTWNATRGHYAASKLGLLPRMAVVPCACLQCAF